jgi:tRNA threonylcarbamoyladenosine biosynthesis protein TsaE
MAIEDHPVIVEKAVWQDEAQTQAFAQALGSRLMRLAPAGNALITLRGDLGAGKTTLVRYLLKALGVEGRIKSPTYAVVEPYTVDGVAPLEIWHFDFYRFNDPDEWEEAGFREIFASTGLKLVEWPDKAGAHLPKCDLDVRLEVGTEQIRHVTLMAHSRCGEALIA